jgi:thiol-disulfide isomerase/thioredoxin
MKNKIQASLFLVAAITMVLNACSDHATSVETSSSTERSATDSHTAKSGINMLPAFSVQDISGNTINLRDLKGKKLVVNLWASWCPPCRHEMPSIEKLQRSVDSSKVSFAMISLDDDFEKAKKYVKSKNISLPVYYPMENLPEIFNVQSIPTTFIFNENGELIHRVDGGEDYDTKEYRELLK